MSKHRRGKNRRNNKLEVARELKRVRQRQPDLDIELQNANPQSLADVERMLDDAGVDTLIKTYKPDTHPGGTTLVGGPSGVNNLGFTADLDPDPHNIGMHTPTHSIGGKPHPHGEIANTLLNIAGYKSHVGPMAPPLILDDRPLIDKLHEATFTHPLGLYAIADDYALRMLLRKAHCFTLSEETSQMVADFSVATIPDLEAARRLAIPPFPVTWIELDNTARLKRMFELGLPLGKYDPANPPVPRLGWLIHPATELGGWYATYVSFIDVGIWVAPMSYWWHAGLPNPEIRPRNNISKIIEWLLFGSAGNVNVYDAHIHASNLHVKVELLDVSDTKDIMAEFAGELRHIWGFLIALAAGQNGIKLTSQSNRLTAPPIMKNGKPLLPLEHKVLHLHLNKKTPQKLITQAITHHHNRQHDVRSHWRTLKSGKRVPVKSHERGDPKLGRIEKTYQVER